MLFGLLSVSSPNPATHVLHMWSCFQHILVRWLDVLQIVQPCCLIQLWNSRSSFPHILHVCPNASSLVKPLVLISVASFNTSRDSCKHLRKCLFVMWMSSPLRHWSCLVLSVQPRVLGCIHFSLPLTLRQWLLYPTSRDGRLFSFLVSRSLCSQPVVTLFLISKWRVLYVVEVFQNQIDLPRGRYHHLWWWATVPLQSVVYVVRCL